MHCDGNGQQHWTWESSVLLPGRLPLVGAGGGGHQVGGSQALPPLPLGLLCHPFFLEAWVGHMETGEPAGQGGA